MAIPKRQHSNDRTNSRRANDEEKPRHLTYVRMQFSGASAHGLPKCRHYIGRKVVEVES